MDAAEQILTEAVLRFPQNGLIHYNLACYRSVMGRADEAKKLLAEAFTLDASLRLIAQDDADLAGVW